MIFRQIQYNRFFTLMTLGLIFWGGLLELRGIRAWTEATIGKEAVFFLQSLEELPDQASLDRGLRNSLGKKMSSAVFFTLPQVPALLVLSQRILLPQKSVQFPSGNHQSLLRSLESH